MRVEDQDPGGAELVEHPSCYARVSPEDRQDIRVHLEGPVYLAGLQRRHRDGGIRHRGPLDTIHIRRLAARQQRGRLLARLIASVAAERCLRAWHPFIGEEDERPAARVILDWNVGVRMGRNPLGHHDESGHRQGEQHAGKWALQPDLELPVVNRAHLVETLLQHQADPVACSPSRNGRHRVPGQHRLAVMEEQAVTQSETPSQSVSGLLVPVNHLRLRRERRIKPEQAVIDHARGFVSRGRDRGHRVERDEVKRRAVAHGAGLALCDRWRGNTGPGNRTDRGAREESATAQANSADGHGSSPSRNLLRIASVWQLL